jgi:hypothetical protein
LALFDDGGADHARVSPICGEHAVVGCGELVCQLGELLIGIM